MAQWPGLGRKPIYLGGTLIFAAAAASGLRAGAEYRSACDFDALAAGLAAAAASVVINALMRVYPERVLTHDVVFVMPVALIAPLVTSLHGGRERAGVVP